MLTKTKASKPRHYTIEISESFPRTAHWPKVCIIFLQFFRNSQLIPVISRYLDTSNDLACLVRGLKLLLKIANSEPFASSLKKDDNPQLDHNLHDLSDAQLEAEVRKRIETLYHPTSSCRMAKLEDGGVVDPFLRVYGLENVRVADASIFPRIPAGHTVRSQVVQCDYGNWSYGLEQTAPSIAVGEKASDMIKESLYRPSWYCIFFIQCAPLESGGTFLPNLTINNTLWSRWCLDCIRLRAKSPQGMRDNL